MRIAPVLSYNRYSKNKNNNALHTQPVFNASPKASVAKELGTLLPRTKAKKSNPLRIVRKIDKKTGNLLRITKYFNHKITVMYEFNPTSQKAIRKTDFDKNGIRTTLTEFSEDTGKQQKVVNYRNDGKTIDSIVEYPSVGQPNIIITVFQKDGKTIDVISENDAQNGHVIKATKYRKDGKTVFGIKEYNPQLDKLTATKLFYPDGKTLKTVREYDLESQPTELLILRYTDYWPDGRIKSVDDRVENIVHIYEYNEDKTLDCICNTPADKNGLETRTRLTEKGNVTFTGPTLAVDNKNCQTKPRTESSFKPTFVEDD